MDTGGTVMVLALLFAFPFFGSQEPRDFEKTLEKLGIARNLFPPLPGNDRDVTYWCSAGEGRTTVLFPVGRADRRYFLNPTWKGGDVDVLSCHSFVNGKARLVWKITLKRSSDLSHSAAKFNGTLANYVGDTRLPSNVSAVMKEDLMSQTELTEYTFHPAVGSLYVHYIFRNGTRAPMEVADDVYLMPSLEGYSRVLPLLITKQERAQLLKNPGLIVIPDRLPVPKHFPTRADPTPLGVERACFPFPGDPDAKDLFAHGPVFLFPAGKADSCFVFVSIPWTHDGISDSAAAFSRHDLVNGKPKLAWRIVLKFRGVGSPDISKVSGTLARFLTRHEDCEYPKNAPSIARATLNSTEAFALYMFPISSDFLMAGFLSPNAKQMSGVQIFDGLVPLTGRQNPLPVTKAELQFLAKAKKK